MPRSFNPLTRLDFMATSEFRRDRTRGVTQATIQRAIRAVKAEDPDAVIEIDPITKKIRITAREQAKAATDVNPWDEVHAKRPA
jgi:hypothetical protein